MVSKDQIYVAKDSGSVEIGEKRYDLRKGVTRVRAGHELTKLDGFDNLFEPVEDSVTYDVEETTAAPGAKRGEKRTSSR